MGWRGGGEEEGQEVERGGKLVKWVSCRCLLHVHVYMYIPRSWAAMAEDASGASLRGEVGGRNMKQTSSHTQQEDVEDRLTSWRHGGHGQDARLAHGRYWEGGRRRRSHHAGARECSRGWWKRHFVFWF